MADSVKSSEKFDVTISNIGSLPRELIELIMMNTSSRDAINLSLSNKTLKNYLLDNDHFWYLKFKHDYGRGTFFDWVGYLSNLSSASWYSWYVKFTKYLLRLSLNFKAIQSGAINTDITETYSTVLKYCDAIAPSKSWIDLRGHCNLKMGESEITDIYNITSKFGSKNYKFEIVNISNTSNISNTDPTRDIIPYGNLSYGDNSKNSILKIISDVEFNVLKYEYGQAFSILDNGNLFIMLNFNDNPDTGPSNINIITTVTKYFKVVYFEHGTSYHLGSSEFGGTTHVICMELKFISKVTDFKILRNVFRWFPEILLVCATGELISLYFDKSTMISNQPKSDEVRYILMVQPITVLVHKFDYGELVKISSISNVVNYKNIIYIYDIKNGQIIKFDAFSIDNFDDILAITYEPRSIYIARGCTPHSTKDCIGTASSEVYEYVPTSVFHRRHRGNQQDLTFKRKVTGYLTSDERAVSDKPCVYFNMDTINEAMTVGNYDIIRTVTLYPDEIGNTPVPPILSKRISLHIERNSVWPGLQKFIRGQTR